MKQNWKGLCLWTTAAVIALSGAGGIQALAELAGTGSQEQPFEGTVQKGDLLQPDAYLKNLTEQDGRKIHLKPLYTPKQYPLVFDANGGAFAEQRSSREMIGLGLRLRNRTQRLIMQNLRSMNSLLLS